MVLIFDINDSLISSYSDTSPPFGYGEFSRCVFYTQYSRLKKDGDKEEWNDTIGRVVSGVYSIMKEHILSHQLYWNDEKAVKSSNEMYERMFNGKFLPPGRGLFSMGTDIVHTKRIGTPLNNCAFISTDDFGPENDLTYPFCFLMEASMLGTGVGFNSNAVGKIFIHEPKNNIISKIKFINNFEYEIEKCENEIIYDDKNLKNIIKENLNNKNIKKVIKPKNTQFYKITDDREGWVESLKLKLESYFIKGKDRIIFDYSLIRPEGEKLKTFGGIASGPKPLVELHLFIDHILSQNTGKYITQRTINDICNLIAKCVVSGNIRRSSLISLGDNTEEFMDLKNYEKNPERSLFGWSSNNSVYGELGQDYTEIANRMCNNGEPGIIWLENMRDYSRMNGVKDYKDKDVIGVNPCSEQTLESGEFCCLVEIFPHKCKDLDDFLRTIKFAYLYAKIVTLVPTNFPRSNRVMLKNRRIGTSISGIAEFLSTHSLGELKIWCNKGYDEIQHWDEIYSNFLCIPKSIKTTTIKPSGSVSSVIGTTSGVHFIESRFFYRRMRFSKTNTLLIELKKKGYHIEDDKMNPNYTSVVTFPIDAGKNIRTVKKVSMFEKFCLTAFFQENWSDNGVSTTITFNPKTEGEHIKYALDIFQYKLKSVSLLPISSHGYEQAPFEEINRDTYKKEIAKINQDYNIKINTGNNNEDVKIELFCDNDSCVLK